MRHFAQRANHRGFVIFKYIRTYTHIDRVPRDRCGLSQDESVRFGSYQPFDEASPSSSFPSVSIPRTGSSENIKIITLQRRDAALLSRYRRREWHYAIVGEESARGLARSRCFARDGAGTRYSVYNSRR